MSGLSPVVQTGDLSALTLCAPSSSGPVTSPQGRSEPPAPLATAGDRCGLSALMGGFRVLARTA